MLPELVITSGEDNTHRETSEDSTLERVISAWNRIKGGHVLSQPFGALHPNALYDIISLAKTSRVSHDDGKTSHVQREF